ncbi:MAG: hypothetical protein Q9166_008131, partial [cf. Caloplaca sp. 2 TL-2023]
MPQRTQPPTNADYIPIYKVLGKAIIGTSNYGPIYLLSQSGPKRKRPLLEPKELRKRIPDVCTWSNIVWNIWKDQVRNSAGSLKYIFKHGVIILETLAIMERTVPEKSKRLKDPGSESDDEGFEVEWL